MMNLMIVVVLAMIIIGSKGADIAGDIRHSIWSLMPRAGLPLRLQLYPTGTAFTSGHFGSWRPLPRPAATPS